MTLERGDLEIAHAILALAREPGALDGFIADLERTLSRDPNVRPALRVDADGRWLITPDGRRVELRVDLGRVLFALIEHRLSAPCEPIGFAALAACGWPDEKLAAHVALERARVAITDLRNAGLAPWILASEHGWLVDPTLELSLRS